MYRKRKRRRESKRISSNSNRTRRKRKKEEILKTIKISSIGRKRRISNQKIQTLILITKPTKKTHQTLKILEK